MIVGIGIDICDISRIDRLMQKSHWENFKKKIFSQAEIEYCQKHKNPAPFFAVRWAIKEAFYKALEEDIQKISSWQSVEYINDGQKKPRVQVIDEKLRCLLEAKGIFIVHCSVSHERENCVAQIILESRRKI